MRVLVLVASKHGGTTGIATRLGMELRRRGLDVDVADIEDGPPIDGYDAYVVGSAVYAGNWLPAAREFLTARASRLAERPVWLFSSGPLGGRTIGELAVADPGRLVRLVGAQEHHVFGGRLDHRQLDRRERIAARLLRAPIGDFRDWLDVDEWAAHIADELAGLGAAAG